MSSDSSSGFELRTLVLLIFCAGYNGSVTLLELIETVPPGVIRSHHGRPHLTPASFTPPKFIDFHLTGFVNQNAIMPII
jgi:hypothetical protein